ncbi:MAG: acyl dehydratase [Gammaproteobacteria bacterium]|jgi:acyl dehydratase
MVISTFSVPPNDRYFEDYPTGAIFELGSMSVTEEEIVEFAERFDPQPFHTDSAAAHDTIYGGIIASGWHTGSIFMRLLVDGFLSSVAGMGSPGIDEIRWPVPVRGGDKLQLRVTIVEARISKSKPDRGITKTLGELFNQNGEIVMSVRSNGFVGLRPQLTR